MSSSEIDYSAVLSDMKAKRDALNAAIQNMELWLGSTLPPAAPQRSNGADIASDTFFSLTIPDAMKKYLGMCKQKKTTNEIAEALERGGMTHGSKNFRNSVATALYREHDKPNGDIAKVGEGEWGLVDWYAGLRAKRMKAAQSPAHNPTEESDDSETDEEELTIDVVEEPKG